MKKVEKNIVVTEFITGVGDLVHAQNVSDEEIENSVKDLCRTTNKFNTPLYLLTNANTNATMDGLKLIYMPLEFEDISVYFHRWDMLFEFLIQHPEIEKVVTTDATDVEMINDPFDQIEDGYLYIGDEYFKIDQQPSAMENMNHNPREIQKFLLENSQLRLLNPGIIAGTRSVLLEFFGMIDRIIAEFRVKEINNIEDYQLGPFDMSLIQYVAYKYFSDRLIHGRYVAPLLLIRGEDGKNGWFAHKFRG